MTGSDSRRGSWIRRFHDDQDRPVRLALLPHAGGSATYYHPFSAALAAGADVLSIQYPVRQDRLAEACIDDIAELADAVYAALRPWLDRPVVLFGHSMGATVAFEVARRIERDLDVVPRSLVVSGRHAPRDVRDHGLHRLSDDELMADVAALSGTDARLLTDPALVPLFLPAIRGDYRAAETYVYQPGPPLRCPIRTLIADADPRVSVADARRWQEYTTGPFQLEIFPGGHFYLAGGHPGVVAAIESALQAGPQKELQAGP